MSVPSTPVDVEARYRLIVWCAIACAVVLVAVVRGVL